MLDIQSERWKTEVLKQQKISLKPLALIKLGY